ncbi:acyltransferase family protein [Pseudomonas bubulae]|uniref:acyltransferase family protein n=1 Tax=Pseudomonas bubulae TaxID=2316085 RepID=UPI003CFDAB81
MTIRNGNFRDDINGLRAWAVVAVILYHFGITGFSGGFVGVDVFFVISGFLMTGIIVKGIEKGAGGDAKEQFSIVSFYLSRARRILPALIVLCCFVLLVGYFYLSKLEYSSLSREVISALGFLSNVNFLLGGGYFDAGALEKPLLHTWSLSVEWQFYIILPLILLAVWKIRPGRTPLIVMMVLGFLISLLLSIVVTPITPSFAFYLLPTRAWEMLAGGLVYLLANRQALSGSVQRLVEGSGFALIIASITLLDSSDLWPGWRALIPVIGTVLVLIAARQGSLWTSNRVAQWLGNCSYSLYLWHWPFAVALAYMQQQDSSAAIVFCLMLSVLCGWLSYIFVETPARTALTSMPRWRGAVAIVAATLIVAVPSLLIRWQDGVSGRLAEKVSAIFDEAGNKNPRMKECHVNNTALIPECTYGGSDLGAIVIGDSHAASLVRSIEKSLPNNNLHVLDWSLNSCQTVAGLKDSKNFRFRCSEFIDYALQKQVAMKSNVPIIIVSRYSVLFDAANEMGPSIPSKYLRVPYSSHSEESLGEMRAEVINTACEFAKTRPVYMMRPIPELKYNVPKTMGRALLLENEDLRVSVTVEDYKKRNAFLLETQDMAAERCGVKLLDPLPYLCSDGRCWGDLDGLPIYYDDDHMNERGGALLIPLFRQIFGKAMADR